MQCLCYLFLFFFKRDRWSFVLLAYFSLSFFCVNIKDNDGRSIFLLQKVRRPHVSKVRNYWQINRITMVFVGRFCAGAVSISTPTTTFAILLLPPIITLCCRHSNWCVWHWIYEWNDMHFVLLHLRFFFITTFFTLCQVFNRYLSFFAPHMHLIYYCSTYASLLLKWT